MNTGNDDIASQIADIVASVCGLDRETIRPESRMQDLGMDSISVMELVIAINERYGLVLPVIVFYRCHDISTLAEFVSNRMRGIHD